MKHVPPIFAALLGSFLFGLVPYFSIELYRSGLDPQSLLFLRYWLAVGLVGTVALTTWSQNKNVPRQAMLILFLTAALVGTLQTYSYFQAIRLIPSSIAILIFFTHPAMTLFIERLVFRTAIRPLRMVSAISILVGSAMALHRLAEPAQLAIEGVALAFTTALCYCVYLQITVRQLRQMPTPLGTLLVYTGLGTGYLVIVLVTGMRTPVDTTSWIQIAMIAVFGGAIPIALFAFSMPRLGPAGYGVVASTELLTVVAIGIIFLGEPFDFLQAAGAAIVVGGIIIYPRDKSVLT
jgi:drug/metabolite transporter (DMT)-like permease